jgi:hypothetical protein
MPVSPEITSRADAVNAARASSDVWPARTCSAGSPAWCATRDARPRSAAEPVIRTAWPPAASCRATAANRFAGQRRPGRARAGVQQGKRLGGLPRRRQQQVSGVGRDARFLAEAAPPGHLVLAGPPVRAGEAARVLAAEYDQPSRVQRGDELMAGVSASVQVDGDVRRWARPRDGLQFARGQEFVERGGQRYQRRHGARCREHDPVCGESPADGAAGRHTGQEVAEAESAEDQNAQWHGQARSAPSRLAACSRVVDRPLR